MGTVFVLVCSLVGFVSGLVSFLIFDASALMALTLWIGSGPVALMICVGLIPFLHKMTSPATVSQKRRVSTHY